MPQRAPAVSAYSFTAWPAAPPVFEGITDVPRLRVPAASGLVAALKAAGGRAGAEQPMTLTNGRAMRGIEFDLPEPPDPYWIACDDESAIGLIGRAEPEQLPEWIERITAAGLVADRCDSPALAAQLEHAVRRPVDTIICTALDTDFSACLNAALAAWHGIELVAGVALLARITRAGQALVVIDARVPATWQSSLRRAAGRSVRILSLIPDYPQSDPTLMLYTLLGRRLRPGRLPAELGVIQVDAAAAIALGRLALGGGAVLSVPLAVRDHLLRQSCFVYAPVGMRVSELLVRTAVADECDHLRVGDVLRDRRVPADAVITAAGELALHAAAPEPTIIPDPCVRCGWCVEACPTRVQPAGVLEAAQRSDARMAQAFGVSACIECGICTYVCPSRLPLLGGIRAVRRLRVSIE